MNYGVRGINEFAGLYDFNLTRDMFSNRIKAVAYGGRPMSLFGIVKSERSLWACASAVLRNLYWKTEHFDWKLKNTVFIELELVQSVRKKFDD